MKKLLLLTTIAIFGFVKAQTKKENIRVTYATEFIIDYEKIKDNIPADYRAAFKAEIDKGIVVNFRLESNGEKSVFRPEEKVNNAQDEGGMLAQEIMASESNPLYKDYVNNEFINVREFGGKTFLVKDKLPDYQWKLTKEKSKINGFNVTKATGTDEEGNVITAWYSTELPYKDGPYRFSNLPGLIVKAEFGNEDFTTVFTMKDIVILDKPIEVNIPTKGKPVTDEEFMTEVKVLQDKYKEMNQGVDVSK